MNRAGHASRRSWTVPSYSESRKRSPPGLVGLKPRYEGEIGPVRRMKALTKWLLGRGSRADYRAALFQELREYLGASSQRRIRELGTNAGAGDSRRMIRRPTAS